VERDYSLVGQIYGFTFAGFVLAGGLGAFLMGAGFDAKGSYTFPLAFASILALAGASLMMALGPYRHGPGASTTVIDHAPRFVAQQLTNLD
jgi:hypothetical protein